jgi:hypothetical protein
MVYVIVIVLVLGVILLVSSPLRRAGNAGADGEEGSPTQKSGEWIDIEAARDAKYRELRDAELDHQTGKLSDADFEAIDSTLRAEAIELLRRLDALDEHEAE